MAYQDSPVSREMTPSEHLAQAADNLAGSAAQLSTAGAVLWTRRQELVQAEKVQVDAQADFDDKVSVFRRLLDQYGLSMSVPTDKPAFR